jgi:prepilin-type processing-associated H-X9-DG protein
MRITELSSGLVPDADLFLAEPYPFDWVREGTSFWLYEENGAFGIPRNGIEAEPKSWENRRYQANFAFADGRVLIDAGKARMHSPFDAHGRPSVLGAGPLSFQCIEPFKRWLVHFEGDVVESTVQAQIAGAVDGSRRVPLHYEIELSMAAPAFLQDVTPAAFTTWGKGVQRDALSVGLGLRFEQMVRGEGEVSFAGERRRFKASGMRVKRRSVRTDSLFLRGHCWQSAVFPDGRAFGYLAYPPHDDGHAPWNRGFIYQDGQMHPATAVKIPWLGQPRPQGDDVSFELRSDLGVTRIKGATTLSTFQMGSPGVWGLNLHQGGARYEWEGQTAFGMIERSASNSAN